MNRCGWRRESLVRRSESEENIVQTASFIVAQTKPCADSVSFDLFPESHIKCCSDTYLSLGNMLLCGMINAIGN